MTLNVNQPTDQELNAMWPYWIRKLATEINTIILTSEGITVNELVIPGGTASLSIDTDLGRAALELVIISGGVSTLESILNGVQGQVKIFVFQDNDLALTDGPKTDGHFYLNQLPAFTDFNAQQDDVIALINIGGDGSSNHGYWKELWRQISVK